MQTILVIAFLALAVLYLANEVRKKFFSRSEACEGCAMSKTVDEKTVSRV